MKLKETTVYVPITGHNKNTAPIIFAQFMRSGNQFESVFFEEYPKHYYLSKEELIELLGSVWDGGFRNGKMNGMGLTYDAPTKKQFINSLFNTEKDGE